METEPLPRIERISLGTGIIPFTKINKQIHILFMLNLRMLSQGNAVLTPLAAGGHISYLANY